MRKGFHTNAFVWAGETDIVSVAQFANDSGYDFLEVGPTFEMNDSTFSKALDKVSVDALCFCRNFCDDDSEKASKEREELYRRMAFASSVGARRVVISTGISQRRSATDHGGCNPLASMDLVVPFLEEALSVAEENGIDIALENCPMQRNIATSPFMLREIFRLVPDSRLQLCYDPSHNVWQYMDIYKPLEEFSSRISHIHIKDTKVFQEKLSDVGIMHNTASDNGFDENQWWRHCILGDGDIDWLRFFRLSSSICNDISYSVEMEDFNYEHDPVKVRKSLEIQIERIRKIERELDI